jgi:tetratricopeptide (TPR) repeat protein
VRERRSWRRLRLGRSSGNRLNAGLACKDKSSYPAGIGRPSLTHGMVGENIMTAPSRVFVGRELSVPETGPVLRAFGDPDDHLRLSVLMAESLRTRVPAVQEEAGACLAPKTTWRERLKRTRELVKHARPHLRELFVLHDVDALVHTGGDPSRAWDDREFIRERSEFFDLLVELFADGGWLVVRPQPVGSVTLRLETLADADAEASAPVSASAIPTLAPVSPDCRSVLQWLLKSKALSEEALNDLIQESMSDSENDLERQILRVAYDHLRSTVQHQAQRLTALRAASSLNGTLGPYPIGDSAGHHRVARDDLDTLRRCGFLQSEGSGSVRMPRAVRSMLRLRGSAEAPEAIRDEHAWLAERTASDCSLNGLVETHYHAIVGLDPKLAIETSRYYATDLRELAFHLSERREFQAAADIYKKILDDFDQDDAYACEYYAYNLTRLDAHAYEATIRQYYEQAYALDRQNPLFHGRWVGFRGRFGEDILKEFDVAMTRYLQSYGAQSPAAVDRFASEVLKALDRGKQSTQKKALVDRWRSQLARIRGLASLLK